MWMSLPAASHYQLECLWYGGLYGTHSSCIDIFITGHTRTRACLIYSSATEKRKGGYIDMGKQVRGAGT